VRRGYVIDDSLPSSDLPAFFSSLSSHLLPDHIIELEAPIEDSLHRKRYHIRTRTWYDLAGI